MDNRKLILSLLANFKVFDKDEEKTRLEIIKFVRAHKTCFDNNLKSGHITGSALVIDRNFKYALLNYHKKLNKWVQFGGHSDGHPNPIDVALREAQEESGLTSLRFIPQYEYIFDVDIHPIPAFEDMPLHHHHDVRILLIADKNEPFAVSAESKDLKWVKLKEAKIYNSQPAFLRLIRKALRLNSKK